LLAIASLLVGVPAIASDIGAYPSPPSHCDVGGVRIRLYDAGAGRVQSPKSMRGGPAALTSHMRRTQARCLPSVAPPSVAKRSSRHQRLPGETRRPAPRDRERARAPGSHRSERRRPDRQRGPSCPGEAARTVSSALAVTAAWRRGCFEKIGVGLVAATRARRRVVIGCYSRDGVGCGSRPGSPGGPGYPGTSAGPCRQSLSKLCVAVISSHSARQAPRPLRWKRSTRQLCFVWANTGSMIACRWRYSCLPSSLANCSRICR
jgi:hypothetical protein